MNNEHGIFNTSLFPPKLHIQSGGSENSAAKEYANSILNPKILNQKFSTVFIMNLLRLEP